MRIEYEIKKLGDILIESKIESKSPNTNKRIRVKLNVQGVEKRPETNDVNGATKYFTRKRGQFIYGKQNLFKGAFGIVPEELNGYESSSDLPAFDVHKSCNPEWIYYYLKQGKFYETLVDLSTGTGSRRVQPKRLYQSEILLPERKVQDRIISEIKMIEEKNSFFQNNVDKNIELIQKLRQRILQDAVSGKLVPQNSKDEPASELLKKIKIEKEKLIREGKIKKQKELLAISDDEIPYELPKGWEWMRLGEISLINPRNHLEDDLDVAFIPMTLIQDNAQNKHGQEIRKWKEIKSGFTHFAEEDVVFAKITPCFQNRNSAILKNLKNKYGAGTTELYVLRSYNKLILSKFLFLLVNTKKFIDDGVSTYKGTAGQQRIKRDFVENYILGLPPLTEQKRIVEKVDELMDFCNQLEEQTKQSRKNAKILMDVVLKENFEK